MVAERDPEVIRVTELLKTAIRIAGVSHREIEKRLGQSPGYLSRLFAGTIELKFRHVLEIIKVIQLDPAEFFQLAYPRQPRAVSPGARKVRDMLSIFPPSEPGSYGGGRDTRERDRGDTQDEIESMIRSAVRKLLQELGGPAA